MAELMDDLMATAPRRPASDDAATAAAEPLDLPEPGETAESLPTPARSRLVRRRRAVLVLAAVAALLSTGGLAGAMLVKSPAQLAADARAPKASVLTAPVVSQTLANTVVLRGDFASGAPLLVTPTSVAATASLTGGLNPGGSAVVLTRTLVRIGDSVGAGQPLAEVSGRPVFVLPGTTPGYRDMLPGESGGDIAQLQDALRGLGLYHGGDTTGYFGSSTKDAVARLYEKVNYPAPVTGAATRQAVQQARQALAQQQQLVDQLQQQGSSSPVGGLGVGPAGTATAPASPSAPGGEQRSPNGPATSGGSPHQQLDQAKSQLAQAQQALDLAQAQDGVMVPASEMAFISTLPARVTALPTRVGDKVTGPVISLTTGGLQLTGYLDPARGALVKPGMKVQITSETLGLSATGTVKSVGALVTPGDQAASGAGAAGGSGQAGGAQGAAGAAPPANGGVPYLPLEVLPDGAWDTHFDGQNVRITIVSAATDSAVLTVPQAAVSSGADARTVVSVLRADGSPHEVEVSTGVSADGNVQVSPAVPGELRAGDRVVIGQ